MNTATRVCAGVAAVVLASLTAAAPASAADKSPRPHPHRAPWPITITVQTAPPLASVRLVVDGNTLTTDAAGRAQYTREHNLDKHALTLLDTLVDQPDRHYRFTRWVGQRSPDQAYRPNLTGLPMRADYTITAAYTVAFPVSSAFVDDHGTPIGGERISEAKLAADNGQTFDVPATGPLWLDGSVPVYRGSKLSATEVSYALRSMVVDGAASSDGGRQRFQPAKTTNPSFTVRFNTLTVVAKDALFRNPVGDQVTVRSASQAVRTAPLSSKHATTVSELPNGPYSVDVRARGVVLDGELNLSKDQTLNVLVITRRDMAAIGVGLILLAAGLLVIGRRTRFWRLLRRRTARTA
jgi:hypothetical protein